MSTGRDGQNTTDAMGPTPGGVASIDAAPSTRDLRDLATTTASALVVRLLGRQREQWLRTAEDVKSALAGLERACETAGVWHATDMAADVADLANGLAAAATTEASAAANRARVEAQAVIDDLQGRLARAEAEALDLRDRLTLATARQHEEHELRLRAEAAWAQLQRTHEQSVSEYQAQLQSERLEVDTERRQFTALRQQLTISLENALRAVQSDDPGAGPGAARGGTPQPSERASLETLDSSDTAGAGDVPDAPASPNQGLKLVTTAPPSATAAAPRMIERVTRLLAEAEADYDADIAANLPPLEVVDRLTNNLRTARGRLVDGAEGLADVAAALFKARVTALLDARAEKPFGRHLGIAFYDLYPVDTIETARKVS